MADAVQSTTVYESPKTLVVVLTNESDGTGESGVVKVDKSTLTGPNGAVPSRLKIMEMSWVVTGFNYVTLDWDADTDDEIDVLSGTGYVSYEHIGGLVDPQSTGATGDILLTTDGGADGSTYSIKLVIQKKD